MRRGGIGLLIVLILLLLGSQLKLMLRVRSLEDELAAPVRTEPKRLPAADPPVASREAAPVAPPPPAPQEPAPPAPAKEKAPPKARAVVNGLTVDLNGQQFTLAPAHDLKSLGLSPAQRQMIDELRKSRDAQARIYEDQIARLDEATDLAIRQLLTPEQLAKYDPPAPPADTLPSGLRPGYLGVSGSDRPGGGVMIDSLMPGGAALGSGLQKGDVILEINGQPIPDYAALASSIRDTGEGVPISMKVRRGDTEFVHGVQLGARPK